MKHDAGSRHMSHRAPCGRSVDVNGRPSRTSQGRPPHRPSTCPRTGWQNSPPGWPSTGSPAEAGCPPPARTSGGTAMNPSTAPTITRGRRAAARGGSAGRPPQVLLRARKHRTRRSLRWSRWTTASVCSPTLIPVRTACSAPDGVVLGPVTQVASPTRRAPVQRVQAASMAGQKSPRASCLDLASVEWPLRIERREAGSRRFMYPDSGFRSPRRQRTGGVPSGWE